MGGDDKAEAAEVTEQAESTEAEAPAEAAEAPAEDAEAPAEAADAPDEPAEEAGAIEAVEADEPDSNPGDAGPTTEDLELENAALKQRVAEYKDKVLRGAAEIENVRRRTAKEVDDAKRFGIDRVLKDLLPVLDNFERALSHGKADDGGSLDSQRESEGGTVDPKAFMDGVEMVLGQLRGALERNGVTPFDSLGQRFDPNLHEAIHRKETDEAEPGTVVEEFQRGYKIHERLARPAMVIVATKPTAPEPEPEPEAEVEDEVEAEEVEVEAEAAGEAGSGGVDLGDLQGDVEVIGATLADATGEMLDQAGASYGAVITDVSELSPASRAGLVAGDLVTDVGSRQVMDARAFKRAVQQSLPRKQPFTIVYRRGGETHETKVGGR